MIEKKPFRHRDATQADLASIKTILATNGLLLEDCDSYISPFIVIENQAKIIGIGGIERCDATTALLNGSDSRV